MASYDYKVVGQALPRVDAAQKATGKAVYTQDINLPGMLHGKVLYSPYPHAKILRVDTSRAKKIPGVKAVLTIEDVPQNKAGLMLQDHNIFAKDRVRCIGDEIAAVAAIDEDTAEAAVAAIDVDFEELPAVFDIEEAMKPGAPLVHEKMADYEMGPTHRFTRTMVPGTNICAHYTLNKGEIENGFRESDYIFEKSFKTHSFHQGYMEPHACTASVDFSGKITVWTATQRPFHVRSYLSETFNLPINKVRVIATMVGGGFGGKTRPRYERFPVALSIKTGRPVKMVMTRDEDFITYRAPAAVMRLKIGVKRDGTLVAFSMDMIWDTGAYGESVHYARGPLNALPGPYIIPHIKLESYAVYTNRHPAYSYRGRVMLAPTFAVESALDMIAEKLGLDPVEFRLKNLFEDGCVNASGNLLRSVAAKESLRKAAEAIGWGRKPGPHQGIAVAAFHKYPPSFGPSTAVVELNADGTVQLLCGAPEIGQGSHTVLPMICAEELGVSPECITMPLCDTDYVPFEGGAHGDRITTTCGNAIRTAAADAREQALDVAAEILEVNKEDLTIDSGRISVKGSPGKGTTLAEVCTVAQARRGGPIIGRGAYMGGKSLEGEAEPPGSTSPVWKYGAQAAHVEVDTETGEVKILKLVCVQDVGKVVNPLSLVGQMHGAALMGIGLTLHEELIFDSGKVTNPSFTDYRIPTVMETVPLETIVLENFSPDGPFGVKGGGEQSTVAVAPAVANALYNAIGVRIEELPITPEKVLQALEEKRKV